MILATSIGIKIHEFWKMTPYEFSIAFHGYNNAKKREAEEYSLRLKHEHDSRLIQAFWTSRWVWTKRVDISKFISQKPKKEMTEEELFNQGMRLLKMYGGETDAKE